MTKQYLFNEWIKLNQLIRGNENCHYEHGHWILNELIDVSDKRMDSTDHDKSSSRYLNVSTKFDNYTILYESNMTIDFPLYINESISRKLEFLIFNPVGRVNSHGCSNDNEYYTWGYPKDECHNLFSISLAEGSKILVNKILIVIGKNTTEFI